MHLRRRRPEGGAAGVRHAAPVTWSTTSAHQDEGGCPRLQRVTTYADPRNVFRHRQPVRPASRRDP
ncbi:BBE domain-containing protein [Streptomyces pharetrae]